MIGARRANEIGVLAVSILVHWSQNAGAVTIALVLISNANIREQLICTQLTTGNG